MDVICWKTKDGRKGECEIDNAKEWMDKYSSTIPDVEYWVKHR